MSLRKTAGKSSEVPSGQLMHKIVESFRVSRLGKASADLTAVERRLFKNQIKFTVF